MQTLKAAILIATIVLVTAYPKVKRQALGYGPTTYTLPDGVELILGQVRSTFSCLGRIYGYYADQDNNCQIFHVCNPIVLPDGQQIAQQFSFFCGNQTVFDQRTLVCSSPDEAVPCNEAQNYLGVNELFFITERPPVRYQQPLLQG